jgi:antitoxin (DNA-binding transcriptional repressor) of toxin-antitoxin stability system
MNPPEAADRAYSLLIRLTLMQTITIQKAKKQLSHLIAKVCQGEEIIIARGKKPVVKLVALPVVRKGPRIPGAWKGKISWTAHAFDPLTDQELKDLGFE